MKTIGLLGGMSWQSSVEYYRLINEAVHRRLGGFHNARSLMYTVDFQDVETLMTAGEWDRAASLLAASARQLEAGGAECVLLCTNTLHKVADAIQSAISIPFLHIVDAVGDEMSRRGCHTAGLLGTRFTMEQDFYRERLERHGHSILIPEAPAREFIHRVIFDELCHGDIRDSSRREFQRIIGRLHACGAQGVILGCTELSLLIAPEHSPVPVFDTTRIHVDRAVEFCLS